MAYIVTGLPRSGTTLMMRCLEAGGIPPVFSAANVMECVNGEWRCGDFAGEFDGKCVKLWFPQRCRAAAMAELACGNSHRHLWIVMRRDPAAIRQSWMKLYKENGDRSEAEHALEFHRCLTELDQMTDHRTITVDYEQLVSNPMLELRRLFARGVPIDVSAAAAIPDARQDHSTKEAVAC